MIRKRLWALALVAGMLSTGPSMAAVFDRPIPPTAAELGLSSSQAEQWRLIQADARILRQSTLQSVKTELSESKLALAQADADLRAIGLDYQTIAWSALLEQRQLRDRRLAFYQSLNPQQQAQVRAFLIQLTERAERAIRAYEVLQGTE